MIAAKASNDKQAQALETLGNKHDAVNKVHSVLDHQCRELATIAQGPGRDEQQLF